MKIKFTSFFSTKIKKILVKAAENSNIDDIMTYIKNLNIIHKIY